MDTFEPSEAGVRPLTIGGRSWPQEALAEAISRNRLAPAENVLVREYFWVIGFKAIKNLLRTNMMAKACMETGRPVRFQFDDRRLLTESTDLRDELTVEVLIKTVPDFFDHRVQNWKATGGASLTTYFIGACIRTFKSVYAIWANKRKREWITSARLAEARFDTSKTFADTVAIEESILQVYNLAKPSQRPVLALLHSGYSQVEAARKLGLSPRAVEGRIYQLRKRVVQAVIDGAISPPAGFATVPGLAQTKGQVMI